MSDPTSPAEAVASTREGQCCIVGGGPAGLMLALLLARKGVRVVLLESHPDFDRDFRGDTVHPSTLEILDQLGLADRLLQLPHGRLGEMRLVTRDRTVTIARLNRLRTRFPFVAIMPQVQFLDFLAAEVRKYPGAEVVMGANVQRLVRDGEAVRGVYYRTTDGAWHEVRAALTVGADGRHSRLRHLVGWEPVGTAPPMDVVWFRLPRRPGDPHEVGAIIAGSGGFCVVLERTADWQLGYVIPKGGYQQLRTAGLPELRRRVALLVPWLADRVDQLADWRQATLLSVESSRLPRWHLPGLLLIGDAAHVMSPVGGVGINYAVQDAVEAANVLAGPLQSGRLTEDHLRQVQRRREWPVKVCQAVQGFIQQQLVGRVLQDPDRPFQLPFLLRILPRVPWLRDVPARFIGFGPRPVRVAD